MSMAGTAMAAPKGKRSDRDDVSVKIDRAVVSKARLIAAHQGITVAELLTTITRSPIDKAYMQMLRELEFGKSE